MRSDDNHPLFDDRAAQRATGVAYAKSIVTGLIIGAAALAVVLVVQQLLFSGPADNEADTADVTELEAAPDSGGSGAGSGAGSEEDLGGQGHEHSSGADTSPHDGHLGAVDPPPLAPDERRPNILRDRLPQTLENPEAAAEEYLFMVECIGERRLEHDEPNTAAAFQQAEDDCVAELYSGQ